MYSIVHVRKTLVRPLMNIECNACRRQQPAAASSRRFVRRRRCQAATCGVREHALVIAGAGCTDAISDSTTRTGAKVTRIIEHIDLNEIKARRGWPRDVRARVVVYADCGSSCCWCCCCCAAAAQYSPPFCVLWQTHENEVRAFCARKTFVNAIKGNGFQKYFDRISNDALSNFMASFVCGTQSAGESVYMALRAAV